MPRYVIFEKDHGFHYPFREFATGKNPSDALNKRMQRGGYPKIYKNRIYMCIPDSVFRKYQFNPKTTGKGKDKKTTWKRPR